MNFPIWDSPRPNLPQKFPPSPITNTQPTKNSPAPRTEQQPRPSHGDIHAAPIAREPDFVWKEGLLTVPRGSRGAVAARGAGPALGGTGRCGGGGAEIGIGGGGRFGGLGLAMRAPSRLGWFIFPFASGCVTACGWDGRTDEAGVVCACLWVCLDAKKPPQFKFFITSPSHQNIKYKK